MKIGPLRTIALCATCAALAGAGSAALAADDDGPGTTAAPPERAGQTFTMRQCVRDPASKAGEGEGEEKCKVTSGGAPPPGGKPLFGGCVKLAPGTGDKAAGGATEKQTGAIECRVTSGGAPPPGGKRPFGGCEKVEPGTGDKAAAAAKQKMAAIAKEKAAAAAGS